MHNLKEGGNVLIIVGEVGDTNIVKDKIKEKVNITSITASDINKTGNNLFYLINCS